MGEESFDSSPNVILSDRIHHPIGVLATVAVVDVSARITKL
jgi:hypothetical protein